MPPLVQQSSLLALPSGCSCSLRCILHTSRGRQREICKRLFGRLFYLNLWFRRLQKLVWMPAWHHLEWPVQLQLLQLLWPPTACRAQSADHKTNALRILADPPLIKLKLFQIGSSMSVAAYVLRRPNFFALIICYVYECTD